MNVLLRMLYVPGVLATTPESPVRLPVRYRSGTTAARTTRYTLAVAATSFARDRGSRVGPRSPRGTRRRGLKLFTLAAISSYNISAQSRVRSL